MSEWDLIVVGSGPAGSTAARVASGAGLRTLVLEKERHPREKPCGGGLSLAAVKALGIDLPGRLMERRCSGVRITQGNHSGSAASASDVAVMVRRPDFDRFLAEAARKAGATLREGEPCLRVERATGEIRAVTPLGVHAAPLVIGADGFFSVTAPLVRPPWKESERRFCLVAEIPLDAEEIERRFGKSVHLDYGGVRMGYAWAFPKRESVSFGIGGAIGGGAGIVSRFRGFIASFGIEACTAFRGCWIPVSRFRSAASSDRVLLSGDAAGFVDCFSGEGIRYAAQSGSIAATVAQEALAAGDCSAAFLARYDRRFEALHKADLIASSRLSALAFLFPDLVLGTMIQSEKVLLRYCDVLRGDLPFRKFAAWSVGKLPGLLIERAFQTLLKKDDEENQ